MPKTKTTFGPGHPYYPKKDTVFNKEELAEFMSKAWPDMVEAFWNLAPNIKWQVYLKLMEYRLPKPKEDEGKDTADPAIELLRSMYGGKKGVGQNS